jgi:hypothetical protein
VPPGRVGETVREAEPQIDQGQDEHASPKRQASSGDPIILGVKLLVLLPAKMRGAMSRSVVHPEYIRREA